MVLLEKEGSRLVSFWQVGFFLAELANVLLQNNRTKMSETSSYKSEKTLITTVGYLVTLEAYNFKRKSRNPLIVGMMKHSGHNADLS